MRIGATWIDPNYIEDFMRETFETPQHLLDRNVVGVQYSDVTGKWNINGAGTAANLLFSGGKCRKLRYEE